MKIFLVLAFCVVLFFSTTHALAQSDYVLLAPLPGLETTADLNTGDGGPVANYFSTIYQIGISLVLVIGVVLLVIGGIQYMTSDSIGGKSNGRDTIARAIIGIVLAVTGYAILFVIGGTGSVTVGFELPPVTYTPPPPPPDGTDPDDPERYCQVSYTRTGKHSVFSPLPRCPEIPLLSEITIGAGETATGIWLSKDDFEEYLERGGGEISATCWAWVPPYTLIGQASTLSIDTAACEAKAADPGFSSDDSVHVTP